MGNFFCGLTIDGKVFTWGSNIFGQLGHGYIFNLRDRYARLHPT